MGMAMGGGRRRRGGGFSDINITPMVDVMLVLLVVFMVTAPLLTTGLRVELPDVKAHNTPVRDSKLVVTVTKDEHIFLGERDITDRVEQELAEIGSQLVEMAAEAFPKGEDLAELGMDAGAIARVYSTFNSNAEAFRQESERHGAQNDQD